jgi:hypothetical protein
MMSPGPAIPWIRAAVVTAGPVSDQSRAPNVAWGRDHLAGRDPDPDLEGLPGGIFEKRQASPDRERAMGRPERVVVVGDGPAEDREHRVPDELLAGPVEALDRIDHRDERCIDPAPDILGVVLGHQPDVIDEVGEERGDDPPIPPRAGGRRVESRIGGIDRRGHRLGPREAAPDGLGRGRRRGLIRVGSLVLPGRA